MRFFDGLPDKATVEKVYDNLDFIRGVDVFLNTMAAASTLANIEGLKSVGLQQSDCRHPRESRGRQDASADPEHPDRHPMVLHGPEGWPIVVEVPPGVLGLADDAGCATSWTWAWSARTRARAASISSFLLATTGRCRKVTSWRVRAPTNYGLASRGFAVKGDTGPAVAAFKKNWRVYPLAQAANPPETKFINGSGLYFNTIHATTSSSTRRSIPLSRRNRLIRRP